MYLANFAKHIYIGWSWMLEDTCSAVRLVERAVQWGLEGAGHGWTDMCEVCSAFECCVLGVLGVGTDCGNRAGMRDTSPLLDDDGGTVAAIPSMHSVTSMCVCCKPFAVSQGVNMNIIVLGAV